MNRLLMEVKDEADAYALLEQMRWPSGPVCPHCGVINHAYHLKNQKTRTGKVSQRSLWKCADCQRQFSVLIGTAFEGSKIPIHKWLIGFTMMCAGKNGVSAHELHRTLDLSYEAAWFMNHRIRYAFADLIPSRQLQGTVEADETYVGGLKPGTIAYHGENKSAVMTLVERDGEARSQVMQSVTSKNVAEVLRENVDSSSDLMTDNYQVYLRPGKEFASHGYVDHKQKEWKRGKVHTNTVEGFFSQLKRSLDGTYHHVSKRHLHRYLAEFDYRYNMRKTSDSDRTITAIRKSAGKRLKYEDTKVVAE